MKLLKMWLEKQKVKRQLHAMTDRELGDIGLTRGDINRIIEQEYTERKSK